MAKPKTYQVIFEGGATTFIRAHSYTVEDGSVVFRGENEEPLEEHYVRQDSVVGVFPDTQDRDRKAGFV